MGDAEGRHGACDRYANHAGELVRLDPLTIIENAMDSGAKAVPFLQDDAWDGDLVHSTRPFVTAVGAGTTYPDYKPAPFIVSQTVDDLGGVEHLTADHLRHVAQTVQRGGRRAAN